MDVQRISAFTADGAGGNPAGVALDADVGDAEAMQRVAAEVGYSETAFASRDGDGWRVRYFAPAMEVPFCGHATIALGAALGAAHGAGVYALTLNDAQISVEARLENGVWFAALASPETRSAALDAQTLDELMRLFGLNASDLDPGLAPSLAFAGARHAILPLRAVASVEGMAYDFDAGRSAMAAADLVTVMLVAADGPRRFRARNAFASGGVYEDPATGAAAAAFAGALRDQNWPGLEGDPAQVEIMQGVEMGRPSRLLLSIPATRGASVRVEGATAPIFS